MPSFPPLGEAPPAAPQVEQASRTTVVTGGDAVDIGLGFVGVSSLYQGYFSTEEWVAALGRDLGACFDGYVEISISYDNEHHIGRILVTTTSGELRCAPRPGAGGVETTGMQPIGRALAKYRDTVANARDLRVGSFRIGVRILHGTAMCDLYWGGQFPPDGTTMSPCITLQGHEVCGGRRHEGLTTLPWPEGEAGRILRACVR